VSRNQKFFSYFLKVVNYLAFYFIWVGCLYAAVNQLSLVAMLVVCGYLVLHLAFVSVHPLAEGVLICSIVLFGTLNDIFLTQLNLLKYVDASWIGASWWMTGLWACFGSTYWHAFSWLDPRIALSACLGAVAVPFCYLWGESAKTVTFLVHESTALAVIGLIWAFLLPLTFIISRAIKRHAV
jgi:hypothetical protein